MTTQQSILTRDFCPWANAYVYWLKQPVGWFLIAMLASVLVGAFASPIGWTLAIGLASILALGLGFPWLAVRVVRCELMPSIDALHEMQSGELLLTVNNRLPIPVWGLMIEGYLSQPHLYNNEQTMPSPEIGLGSVPPLSRATFRLRIQPAYRGHYPVSTPKVCCAFPFGIWTARRDVSECRKVVVRPLLLPLTGMIEVSGQKLAESGSGNRVGTTGDFLGVREFRRGDSLRSIHWAHTARTGNFVVCERGGPQLQTVYLELSTDRCSGTPETARENLAWRVRIAASLIDLLGSRHIPFRLIIDGTLQSVSKGNAGINAALDVLASIPHDIDAVSSTSLARTTITPSDATRLTISAIDRSGATGSDKYIQLAMHRASSSIRNARRDVTVHVDLDSDIASAVDHFLMEASHVAGAA